MAKVCIVGGGPAGMVLGLLLARAGIDTTILEKHEDFLRDFRGDTVHPSTLRIFRDLGLLDRLLAKPHYKASRITGVIGSTEIPLADFSHLPDGINFIAFMPQWDFLNFVATIGKELPSFQLHMNAKATALIEDKGAVRGVVASTANGDISINADLVVGCDGRHSFTRAAAHFNVENLGAPIDVLWMKVSRKPEDPEQLFGRFAAGSVFIMLNRGDYWQCAFVIAKGSLETLKAEGIDQFQKRIAQIAPPVADRVHELDTWDKVKLLDVKVDRLRHWAKPGLLCIGDSAHAMSPVAGVGINLAIQDAVATANILVGKLKNGQVDLHDLEKVHSRRHLPTVLTQKAQIEIHKRILSQVLGSQGQLQVPMVLRLFQYLPFLRRIPAAMTGLGLRPERPDLEQFSPWK